MKKVSPKAPLSLEQAFKAGWKINEQLSGWTFTTANKRDGFLLLTKPGERRTLYIPFVALYELRRPYFL